MRTPAPSPPTRTSPQGRRPARRSAVVALGLALFTSSIATAADGVVEINQTCAVQTGCLPGDAPGFPVSITSAGSYLLTSDLVVDGGNESGILVGAPGASPIDVSIDMNGFSIRGPVVCSVIQGLSCSNTGSGPGIGAATSNVSLSVRNGTIRGMGSRGIGMTFSNSQLRAESVRLIGNGSSGVSMLQGELVDCRAERNGGIGFAFSLNADALGRDLHSRGNGSHGIEVRGGVRLVNPVAVGNFGDGIRRGSINFGGNLVTGCLAKDNDGTGLLLDETDAHGGCTLVGNNFQLAGGVAIAASSCGGGLCP